MSHLIPLEDYVIVEIAQPEKTTKSGIILPTKNDEKPGYGTVVAV
jgi:co-chaperonin GroES (HSP10)